MKIDTELGMIYIDPGSVAGMTGCDIGIDSRFRGNDNQKLIIEGKI